MPPRPEPFDPVDFFSVARTIAQEQTEGAFRTAVSRAYYCVFHLARQSTGINRAFGGNSVHWEVLAAVKHNSEDIGQKLEELYRLRKVADYQLLPNRRDDPDWKLNWRSPETIATEIIPKLQSVDQGEGVDD